MGQPKRRRERIAALHVVPGHGPVATIQQTDEGSSSGDNVNCSKIVHVEMVQMPTIKESHKNGRHEDREGPFAEM